MFFHIKAYTNQTTIHTIKLIISEIDVTAAEENLRDFHRTTQKIEGKYINQPSGLIKNSNWKILTHNKDQVNRQAAYFENFRIDQSQEDP